MALPFLLQTLAFFNRGEIDPNTAAELLSVSRAHLFRLRAAWLQHPATFALQLSGGNHHAVWPAEVQAFLQTFLPLQRPPNYQLVADELAAVLLSNATANPAPPMPASTFPGLIQAPAPVAKPRRRWERAHFRAEARRCAISARLFRFR